MDFPTTCSHNSVMGRRKTYDGVIERVTEPAFSKKYNWWSFSVKHDGKWNSVTSRDKKSAQNQYKIYVRRSKANECGINLVSTPLTEQQLQIAQLAFNRLDTVGHLKIDDDKTAKVLIESVDFFIKNYTDYAAPTVNECVGLFLEKQQSRNLSEATLNDYKYLLNELMEQFGEERVSYLNAKRCKKFIEKREGDSQRRARFIYLKAFMEFCAGKKNIYCEDTPWLKRNPINWEMPKFEAKEIAVYTFDEIVELLKEARERGVLGHFIFRLFSMMRTKEMSRFTELGGSQVADNKFINLNEKRITINNLVYKKRGRAELRGRHYNDIPGVFVKWIKYLRDNEIPLECSLRHEKMTRGVVKRLNKVKNVIRHTAITYNTLKFRDALKTAYAAGNSVNVIQNHYLNMNVDEDDVRKLYELTPIRAKELGIL